MYKILNFYEHGMCDNKLKNCMRTAVSFILLENDQTT